jgi:hypothetical protein
VEEKPKAIYYHKRIISPGRRRENPRFWNREQRDVDR